MWTFFSLILAVIVIANILFFIRHKSEGEKGLNQWPNPHGRYYDEWMELKNEPLDYYEWLNKKMGNKEPWKTWEKQEKSGTINKRASCKGT